jgi:hypothetical protein
MQIFFLSRMKYTFCKYAMIILLMLYGSCNNSQEKNHKPEAEKPAAEKKIIKKPPSSFNDTIIINYKSAVFYSPDSLQMEKIKAVNKKTTYAMLEHDCYFQMRNAKMVIEQYWPQVKIIEASKARYLLFMKENKIRICIDLNDKNDICGIFLFDPKKNPVLIDMPNIETELGFYFKK